MYTEQFTEVHDILATLKPTAANAAVGVHNSGYVSLADYHRSFAWLGIGEPAQGATIDVAITQATSAAGAGAVPLLTVGALTKNPAQIVAADIGQHVGIEVRSEELDVTNGYIFINVAVTVGTDTFYYDLVIFGIVSRYEPVGVTDFLYLMP
jgi:hypothetical protein